MKCLYNNVSDCCTIRQFAVSLTGSKLSVLVKIKLVIAINRLAVNLLEIHCEIIQLKGNQIVT